jgi:hypothetical protein
MIASLSFLEQESVTNPLYLQFVPEIPALLFPVRRKHIPGAPVSLHDMLALFHCNKLVVNDALLRIHQTCINWREIVSKIGNRFLELHDSGQLPSADFGKHLDQ